MTSTREPALEAPAHGGNAAPAWRRILRHGGYETSMMMRNGEQLVLAVVLPLLALVALEFLSVLDGLAERRIDVAAPGVLALCVMSTAFTGQGIATGFDRRYGVLRFLSTTPLGRGGLVFGKALAVAAVLAIQIVVVGGTAALMGWRPAVGGIGTGVLLLLLGAATFTSLGLLIAGTVRAEATLAITNLVWILLAAGGGVLIPGSRMPGLLEPLVQLLPSAALGDGLRAALVDGAFPAGQLLALGAWTVVAGFAATKWFKWN
ncbi:ABC transporter permease [Zafaria sp. Z1313]|uniref:ABC transporter permease n=1 Tax=unclassified Zafaria TaxID=2828765 RepID=UPI002E77043B|nr:ABC transporter permease [Zafaria sp. J156]MEE1620210.1 ABC transporter permease [Zafaria sp. J156]